MGKSVQDLIDSGKIKISKSIASLDVSGKELTSLKGVEGLTNLKRLECHRNKLTSLEGIEGLVKLEVLICGYNQITSLKGIEGLTKLSVLFCNNNLLSSLEGIEGLKKLRETMFYSNPCDSKYKGMSNEEKVQKIKLESHLKDGDDLRGAASISDTGLFDFKMK